MQWCNGLRCFAPVIWTCCFLQACISISLNNVNKFTQLLLYLNGIECYSCVWSLQDIALLRYCCTRRSASYSRPGSPRLICIALYERDLHKIWLDTRTMDMCAFLELNEGISNRERGEGAVHISFKVFESFLDDLFTALKFLREN